MNYYELLDIDKTASQMEIKKAYFNKVKQYSPEKNPELFKKIRKAYDTLRNPDLKIEYERTIGLPDDERIARALELLEVNNFKNAADLLKKVMESHPKSIALKELLADTYENNKSYGNSSKIYEMLVNEFPDNHEYVFKLAYCHLAMNHKRKAKTLFDKAIEIYPLSSKLWCDWIRANIIYEHFNLEDIISRAESFSTDILKENYDIYGLVWIKQNNTLPNSNAKYKIKSYDLFSKFIKYYENDTIPSKFNTDVMINCLRLVVDSENMCATSAKAAIDALIPNISSENVFKLDYIEITYASKCLYKDKKPDEVFHDLTAMASELIHNPNQEIEIGMMAAKVYIISRFSKLRDYIIYYKENFPRLYEYNAKFYNDIMDDRKRKSMEKSVKKQIRVEYEISKFDTAISRTLPNMDDDLFFDEDYITETPFRRDEPKIGRNDPCPCGSGKKYKKCCGNL